MKTTAKRAFTLMETMICTALLGLLVWGTVMIIGVTNYAVVESNEEFAKMNGYDVFLDAYTDSVKNAVNIYVFHNTLLEITTSQGSHTFEFANNRLRMDDEELFKARNGSFYYDGRAVTLKMQPNGFGEIELTIYADKVGF